jgi:hypothetical protein
MSGAISVSKTSYAKEFIEANSRLEKAKHAVAILEKARVDPVVRGTATIDYVEDKLCKGKILINHLEEKIKILRTFKIE